MADFLSFDRPQFDQSFVCGGNRSKAFVALRVLQTRIAYDIFLDNILPQQRYYADFLQTSATWRANFTEQKINELLAEFRSVPCMNDPTEGSLEQIERDQDGYPILLAVALDSSSCTGAIMRQNLNEINDRYTFFANGMPRMLACDFRPWEDQGIDPYEILLKYQSLGCLEVGPHNIRRCLIIPKTDDFRREGDHFYSRPYFGTFDVLASCYTYLD
ncbi:hypothetical protein ACVWXQ_000021 [Bradyrhizobium sp. S3.14.4]